MSNSYKRTCKKKIVTEEIYPIMIIFYFRITLVNTVIWSIHSYVFISILFLYFYC